MKFKEIDGDLIELAKEGKFDVIVHGCNCFCTMGAGIAPQMAKAFNADKFPMEHLDQKGNINKLGTIDYQYNAIYDLTIVNAYSQYGFGRNHEGGIQIPLDYNALILCLIKINHVFSGKKIGLPKIGCGLAGGDWIIVKNLIQDHLINVETVVVNYKPINK